MILIALPYPKRRRYLAGTNQYLFSLTMKESCSSLKAQFLIFELTVNNPLMIKGFFSFSGTFEHSILSTFVLDVLETETQGALSRSETTATLFVLEAKASCKEIGW